MTANPTALEQWGIAMVGYNHLGGNPGFKLGMQEVDGRFYLYLCHMWRSGWSVLDVTNPEKPQVVWHREGPAQTWTLQVQVADGLMLTSLERPGPGWGMDPAQSADGGIQIWDVADDPANPRLVADYLTGGRGTHRNFYAGGRFALLAAEPDGYQGNILVVVDIEDPTRPKEVSRWSWPGQHVAGDEKPDHDHYLHGPPYLVGDVAYLPYGRVGLVVIDLTDPHRPELVGHVSFGDLGSDIGCHSAVPYRSDILVVNSEAIAESAQEQLNYAVTVDVADPAHPRVVGWLPVPSPSSDAPYRSYVTKGGRFGPHNQHHHQGQACLYEHPTKVFMTYFNAGLRRYDISDPCSPVETGYFVPSDPTERYGTKPHNALVTQFEDVLVDRRGYIYCTDKNHGLLVLQETDP